MLKNDIKPYLRKLKARKITNRAVAKLLGVREQSISRILQGIEKAPTAKHQKIDKQLRTTKAAEARAGLITISQAASAASCSTRTIYRYMK
jgi:IS30 family transposase